MKRGQTIEYLRCLIESEYEIEMMDCSIFLSEFYPPPPSSDSSSTSLTSSPSSSNQPSTQSNQENEEDGQKNMINGISKEERKLFEHGKFLKKRER